MKQNHKGGGGSLGFHTLIQISYILVYMSSFTVKIWIRISQIQDGGGGHHFVKVFHKILFFLNDGFPKSLLLFLLPVTEAWATQACPTQILPLRLLFHFAWTLNGRWLEWGTSWRLPASLLSIRKALGRPPGAGRCLGSYRTNRPTGGQGSSLTSVSVELKFPKIRNCEERF